LQPLGDEDMIPNIDSNSNNKVNISVKDAKGVIPPSFVINGVLATGNTSKFINISTQKLKIKYRGFYLNGEEFASSATGKKENEEDWIWYNMGGGGGGSINSSNASNNLLESVQGIRSLFSSHRVNEGDRLIVTIFPQFGVTSTKKDSISGSMCTNGILCFDLQILELVEQNMDNFTFTTFIQQSRESSSGPSPPVIPQGGSQLTLPPVPQTTQRFTISQPTIPEGGGTAASGPQSQQGGE